ncbi:hypothetical protein ASF41_22460 [Methylobacterium sp. Leaf111]|nr:hypothetical protein ASF41_22460 [Methylobacterium sp. Leaf111]
MGLTLDVTARSVNFDLNGSTLQQASDVTVVSVRGGHAPQQQAVIGHSGNMLTVRYAGADKVGVGTWVKIFADDELPNDQGASTRVGQALQVVAVDGDRLTLAEHLLNEQSYTQNIRASAYESGVAVLTNGTVSGQRDKVEWNSDLVQLRSTVGAEVSHLTVRDSNSTGINVIDGVNIHVLQSAALNLSDDVENGSRGYGVHSSSSTGTLVDGFYAEAVRHAVDDNSVGLASSNANPSKYGADIGLHATNVIVNGATATAFSWHSEGRLGSVHDSVVINSWGVLGARGVGNSMHDVSAAGNGRGIQFYEYGDGDGSDIRVANVKMTDLSVYAFTSLGDVHDNTISDSFFHVTGTDSFGFEGVRPVGTIVVGGPPSPSETSGSDVVDRILGTAGRDTVHAGAGNDYIWGGQGADDLTGGAGSDRFAYYAAGEGGDLIRDFDTRIGGDVLDVSVLALRMGWTGDVIANGHIRLEQTGTGVLVSAITETGRVNLATVLNADAASLASHISTTLMVTDATDVPRGEVHPDQFPHPSPSHAVGVGGSGGDLIFGGEHDARLSGNAGDDRMYDSGSTNVFIGGTGSDLVSYRYGDGSIVADLGHIERNTGWAAGDRYSQIESLEGTDYSDVLIGNDGINRLFGRDGDDVLRGGDGADYLDGGFGNDTLYGGDKNDELHGRQGDDVLYGGSGKDFLDGGAGNDLLYGGNGDDRFDDYSGADIFHGGAGRDVFVFTDPSQGTDTIADFQRGLDKIIVNTIFLGLPADMSLKLVTSDAALSDPHLYYNKDTGDLTYRQTSLGTSVQVMHLEGGPTLASSDLWFT